MNNKILLNNIKVSPMAYYVWNKIQINEENKNFIKKTFSQDINLYIDLLLDAMKYKRYRDFSNPLSFKNDIYGKRTVNKIKKVKRNKRIELLISTQIFNKITKLKKLGITNSWIIEESLFYAQKNNLI